MLLKRKDWKFIYSKVKVPDDYLKYFLSQGDFNMNKILDKRFVFPYHLMTSFNEQGRGDFF